MYTMNFRLFDQINVAIETDILALVPYICQDLTGMEASDMPRIDYRFRFQFSNDLSNIHNIKSGYRYFYSPHVTLIDNVYNLSIYTGAKFDYSSFRQYFNMWATSIASEVGIACLHGAAVRVSGKTILILGNSGNGKSSLVDAIINAFNGRFISDDLLFINSELEVYRWLRTIGKKVEEAHFRNKSRTNPNLRGLFGGDDCKEWYFVDKDKTIAKHFEKINLVVFVGLDKTKSITVTIMEGFDGGFYNWTWPNTIRTKSTDETNQNVIRQLTKLPTYVLNAAISPLETATRLLRSIKND